MRIVRACALFISANIVVCSEVFDPAQSQPIEAESPNSMSLATAADSVEFSAASYAVAQADGSVALTVNRGHGSSGAASIRYATSNGTASGGVNYAASSGTLSWPVGDMEAKTFAVPVSASPAFEGIKTFTVTLSSPTHGTVLGTRLSATVTISGSTPTHLAVSVQGNHLVDGKGSPLQLRGVNVSGLEYVAIQGWSAGDPWGGGQKPNWDAIKKWKANAVRLPLNEASWLGRACKDPKSGAMRSTDPGRNYVATAVQSVDEATAVGFYVVLDLHWSAPGPYCPRMQNAMADADNSIEFWKSVAQTFKNQRNVAFELFNEPFITKDGHSPVNGDTARAWPYLMAGSREAPFTGFAEADAGGGSNDVKFRWQIATMQSMLDAIRATGAENVVLVGGQDYSQQLDGWAANHAADPLKQMAAAWHAYPKFKAAFGTAEESQPNYYPQIYKDAQAILDAGFPILITEIGEVCTPGTPNAPEVTNVTKWADAHAVSVFGWTWDNWYSASNKECANVLILDRNGTPTPGYGRVFHDWMVNHP